MASSTRALESMWQQIYILVFQMSRAYHGLLIGTCSSIPVSCKPIEDAADHILSCKVFCGIGTDITLKNKTLGYRKPSVILGRMLLVLLIHLSYENLILFVYCHVSGNAVLHRSVHLLMAVPAFCLSQ